MKPKNQSTPLVRKSWLWPALALAILVVIGLWIWHGAAPYVPGGVTNYAEQAAKPMDTSLIQAGAIKQCSRGDAGKGPDNDRPWYNAMYQVPTAPSDALNFLNESAKKNGFNLTPSTTPSGAGDNKFYGDYTSKRSSYSDLQDGNVELSVTIYGSSVYSGDELCTVNRPSIPATDHTTILVGVNLPRVKK